MLQFEEKVRLSFAVILRKYIVYYAFPSLVFLPVAMAGVAKLIPGVPEFSGGWPDLYWRCYTGAIWVLAVPVLGLLGIVAYSNNVKKVLVKGGYLILPISTEKGNPNVVTRIPLEDIASIETKSRPEGTSPGRFVRKTYRISLPGYSGNWVVVEYSRPKTMLSRTLARLGKDRKARESERIRIEFPSERGDELKRIVASHTN